MFEHLTLVNSARHQSFTDHTQLSLYADRTTPRCTYTEAVALRGLLSLRTEIHSCLKATDSMTGLTDVGIG